MQLTDIFSPDSVLPALKASSKSQVLRAVADAAGQALGLDPKVVFDALHERERLGSTAIGGGVALPHAKVAGVEKLAGWVACLETPLDFDAIDDEPVDLVVVLLAPETAGAEHLRVLAQLSRIARDAKHCSAIRQCRNGQALWQAFTGETRRQERAA